MKKKEVKRTSEVRAQIDRWPVEPDGDHVLTIIMVCTFNGKPEREHIIEAMAGAAEILKEGKTDG